MIFDMEKLGHAIDNYYALKANFEGHWTINAVLSSNGDYLLLLAIYIAIMMRSIH